MKSSGSKLSKSKLRYMRKYFNYTSIKSTDYYGADNTKKAGPYLINPIKNIITIRREDLPDSYFYAGEIALSEYSMLNPPPIPEVAVYKDSLNEKTMNTLDSRWAEPNDELVHVELWNYDPALFSFEGKVDPVSLACTLKETDNERVEDAVNEMMEEWTW